MITLIGTGHVFDLSQAILHNLDEKQPNIICVELDKQRYAALQKREEDPEAYQQARKNAPFIYRLIARFQETMAKQYGVEAGDEMMTAIKYAQSHQLPVGFIDINAQQMFNRMFKKMSVKEKIKLFLTGFTGFFISKKKVEKELNRYQKNFDKYIKQIG
ncbi:MAG: TraB domain-containing protein, partial [Candidatus Thermoplasmatota archaeon]